jgi:hypothetical protein
VSEPGSPEMATISVLGSWARLIGSGSFPGLATKVGVRPPSPGGVLGVGTRLPSPDGAPVAGAGLSSSSHMDGLNWSCRNMPEEGSSRLDLSQARASAASLSHRRTS